MKSTKRLPVSVFLLLLLFAIFLNPAGDAFVTHQAAFVAVGESDLFSNSHTTSNANLVFPYGVAFDRSGNLWVSDTSNNRILEFVPPLSTDMVSAQVIGQKDFTSRLPGHSRGGLDVPLGIIFDSYGNLWVADRYNNRVVEYTAPYTDGLNASLVIGQPNYANHSYGVSRTKMNSPSGLSFDKSGNLWVVDEQNSRVLEFTPPFSDGMAASLVIGQHNFTANFFSSSPAGLTLPYGATFDSSGNLWVSDTSGNRVVLFRPPFHSGMNASLVLGEPTFFTSGPGTTTRVGLVFPTDLAFDSQGNLWVSEVYNNRTVEFSPPFTNGEAASIVIGQPDFESRDGAILPEAVNAPDGLAFDAQGNLWLADTSNNRILEYSTLVTAQGISTTQISGGSALANQTANTGASLTITGSTSRDGTVVRFITQVLRSQPSSTFQTHLNNTRFQGVQIDGVRDGSARYCVEDAAASPFTVIQFWNSTKWSDASKISQSGKSICGTFPVAALINTWLAVGDSGSHLTSSFPYLILIPLGIVAAGAAIVALFAVRSNRRRAKSSL